MCTWGGIKLESTSYSPDSRLEEYSFLDIVRWTQSLCVKKFVVITLLDPIQGIQQAPNYLPWVGEC